MGKKWFIYRSVEEFAKDVSGLGVDVPMDAGRSAMFRPVRIGRLAPGNAWAIHPMEGCDGAADGAPDELTFRRYRRFGAGGAKLIWGEATAITLDARANPRQLAINEGTAGALGRMLEETRRAHREAFGRDDDLVVGLQLTHSGRYSLRPVIAQHDPALDPATFVDRKRGLTVTPDHPLITDDELERLEDRYVEAARMVARLGYDFVDIKQCHRYLMNELLSGRDRPGRYGGSFENRTRFARNVFGKIRDAVGDRLVLATRLNVFDGVPFTNDPQSNIGVPRPHPLPYRWGWGVNMDGPLEPDFTEPLRYVGLLRDWGVALIDVSMGSPYSNYYLLRPFDTPSWNGYDSPEHPLIGVDRHFRATEIIQRAYPDLAVVGSGYSWLRHFMADVAEANLKRGRVTMVGVGRGALAYPDWVKDLVEKGAMERRNVCITVSDCTTLMRWKHNPQGQYPTGCVPRDKVYAEIYREGRKALEQQEPLPVKSFA